MDEPQHEMSSELQDVSDASDTKLTVYSG